MGRYTKTQWIDIINEDAQGILVVLLRYYRDITQTRAASAHPEDIQRTRLVAA
jgi:hypothetical protein